MYILAAPIHTNPLLRCLAFHSVTLRFLHVPMFFLFLGSLRITYGSPSTRGHEGPQGNPGRQDVGRQHLTQASRGGGEGFEASESHLEGVKGRTSGGSNQDWVGEDL